MPHETATLIGVGFSHFGVFGATLEAFGVLLDSHRCPAALKDIICVHFGAQNVPTIDLHTSTVFNGILLIRYPHTHTHTCVHTNNFQSSGTLGTRAMWEGICGFFVGLFCGYSLCYLLCTVEYVDAHSDWGFNDDGYWKWIKRKPEAESGVIDSGFMYM